MDRTSETEARLTTLSTNLMVNDVDATLFYYTALGFKVLHRAPETGPAQWAHVGRDGVRLMFQSTASLKREFTQLSDHSKGGALTLWIQVENVAAWYAEVKGRVDILKDFGTTSYNGASEFVAMDPNGFILHFSDMKLTS